MGLRFRRSLRIAPGLRLNFGMRGVSATVGPRGAKLTVGPSGSRVTTSLPGTGLSATQKIGGARRGEDPTTNHIPTGQGFALLAIGVGTIAMLIREPGLVAIGWLMVWISVGVLLKGNGAVIAIGGSFVLSLVAMAAALKMGFQ